MAGKHLTPRQRAHVGDIVTARVRAAHTTLTALEVQWAISTSVISDVLHKPAMPITSMLARRFAAAFGMPYDDLVGPAEEANPYLDWTPSDFLDHLRNQCQVTFDIQDDHVYLTTDPGTLPPQIQVALEHHKPAVLCLLTHEHQDQGERDALRPTANGLSHATTLNPPQLCAVHALRKDVRTMQQDQAKLMATLTELVGVLRALHDNMQTIVHTLVPEGA